MAGRDGSSASALTRRFATLAAIAAASLLVLPASGEAASQSSSPWASNCAHAGNLVQRSCRDAGAASASPSAERAFANSALQALAVGEGEIKGHVTAAATAAAVEDVEACAASLEPDRSGSFDECARSDAGGAYTIERLSPGPYRVSFTSYAVSEGNFAPQYYKEQADPGHASAVTVNAGAATEGIDAALTTGASFHGTVTGGGAPAEKDFVCAEDLDAFEFPGESICGETNAKGEYTIGSLATGSYVIEFSAVPVGGTEYAGQADGGVATFLEAQTLEATEGQTTQAGTEALSLGASFEGTVVDRATGKPLKEAQICPLVITRQPTLNCVETNAAGEYTFLGVHAGQYLITAEASFGSGYALQFYPDVYREREAKPVVVSTGEHKKDIDFALEHGPRISGRITSAITKVGVKDVEVCAFDPEFEARIGPRCESTSSNGEYTYEELSPGTYTLSFFPEGSEFAEQFYNGRSFFGEGDQLVLGPETVLTNVDAVLALGGTITGTVRGNGGAPLAGSEVCAYVAATEEFAGDCGVSDSGGTYTIENLPTGTYKVEFSSETDNGVSYAAQFFGGSPSFTAGAAVSVTVGQTTAAVNETLVTGGTIEGVVGDASSRQVISDVEVCAFASAGESFSTCAFTDATGHYAISGLPSGDYRILFVASERFTTPFARQYFHGVGSYEAGAPVGVIAGHVTSEIDAAMIRTASPTYRRSPFVSGKPEIGQTLRDGSAEWLNVPLSYSYSWQRCDGAGNACEAIVGASGRRYSVTAADVGHTLRVTEVAANADGATAATSGPSRVVPATAGTPPNNGGGGGGVVPPPAKNTLNTKQI
ncbi:MAG TPA: carboxypeptidase regulatory-like domain-containing protein, partial [Solirubrobacteraceae bacterium]|nr:carboxypeptidase regulatory-like domain-containing protein [Solirubrobacteraceae bacterium]